MTNIGTWFNAHEIGVTLIVLVLLVPWYVFENVRRKGNCKPQLWFTFALNLIGVMAGGYIFASALVGALARNPVNDQKTLMAAFGAFVVVVFTTINIWTELRVLLMREIQPKRRPKP